MIEITCEICGTKFWNYPSNYRRYCGKYCSLQGRGADVRKHGQSKTRLHGIWSHMKTRCLCETSNAYQYYGGRGIRVCEEWIESYEVFRDWAHSSGYSDDLEIDRIDVNGNYEPSNCRWATRRQQMANTRKRKGSLSSKYKGVSWNRIGKNWKVQINKDGKNTYVGVYKTEDEAAAAYDVQAKLVHGVFAVLNFPQEPGGVPC